MLGGVEASWATANHADLRGLLLCGELPAEAWGWAEEATARLNQHALTTTPILSNRCLPLTCIYLFLFLKASPLHLNARGCLYPEPHTSSMSTLACASLRQTPLALESVLHSTSFFLWGSLYESTSSYLHHVSVSLFPILSFSAELCRSYPYFPVTPHSPRLTHADLMI